MARPTKLTPDMITKAQEYIESCKDEDGFWAEYKDPKTGKVKQRHWVKRLKVNIPTIEGLALALKINRSTVYEWSSPVSEEQKKDIDPNLIELRNKFSDIVEQLLYIQAKRLLEGGLSGEYNSTIAKLILSGKHDYVEKKSTDITSGGDKLKTAPLIVSDIGADDESKD